MTDVQPKFISGPPAKNTVPPFKAGRLTEPLVAAYIAADAALCVAPPGKLNDGIPNVTAKYSVDSVVTRFVCKPSSQRKRYIVDSRETSLNKHKIKT